MLSITRNKISIHLIFGFLFMECSVASEFNSKSRHSIVTRNIGEAMTLADSCHRADSSLVVNMDEIIDYARKNDFHYNDAYREALKVSKADALHYYLIEKKLTHHQECLLAERYYGPNGSKKRNLIKHLQK